MNACPKCGSTAGYVVSEVRRCFELRPWDWKQHGEAISVDSVLYRKNKMAKCDTCGYLIKLEHVEGEL